MLGSNDKGEDFVDYSCKNMTKAHLTDLAARLQVNPKDISIDADLEELSAVVTYVVETTYLDASGVAIDSEKVKIREGLV